MHTWLSGENQSVSTGLNKSTLSKHLKTICLAVVGAHGRVTLCCESQGDDSVAAPLPEIGTARCWLAQVARWAPVRSELWAPCPPHTHMKPHRGLRVTSACPSGPLAGQEMSPRPAGTRGAGEVLCPQTRRPATCTDEAASLCSADEKSGSTYFLAGRLLGSAGEGAMPSPPFAGAAGRPRPAARTLSSDSRLSDGAEQFGGRSR